MPYDAQRAYDLYMYEGWSCRQIAHALGCSEQYVHQLIDKAGDPVTYYAVRRAQWWQAQERRKAREQAQ